MWWQKRLYGLAVWGPQSRRKMCLFHLFLIQASLSVLCQGLLTISLVLVCRRDAQEEKDQIQKESRILDTQWPCLGHQDAQTVFISGIFAPGDRVRGSDTERGWVQSRLLMWPLTLLSWPTV